MSRLCWVPEFLIHPFKQLQRVQHQEKETRWCADLRLHPHHSARKVPFLRNAARFQSHEVIKHPHSNLFSESTCLSLKAQGTL